MRCLLVIKDGKDIHLHLKKSDEYIVAIPIPVGECSKEDLFSFAKSITEAPYDLEVWEKEHWWQEIKK